MKSRLAVGIFLVLLVIGVLLTWTDVRQSLSPPEIRGGVLRLKNADGDRLYLVTTQWQQRQSYRFGRTVNTRGRTISWVYTDLWVLDAVTAQPVARHRLKRDKVNGDAATMGVDQGVLWARVPELIGIRLSTGEVVADTARIEARNPRLAGLMPKSPEIGSFLPQEMQPLKFVADAGLVVLLADARRMRIDPLTLAATPHAPPAADAAADPASAAPAGVMPVHSLSQHMDWRALLRGVRLDGPGEVLPWLGLIAEEELADPKTLEQHVLANWWDYGKPQRQRLYRAELKPTLNYYGGKVLSLSPPQPLHGLPEFLMGGLLSEGPASWQAQPALRRGDPDSVYVLSRDRLGDEGHLQLARVTAAEGRVLWSNALPLSQMSAWLPGERPALMLGPDPAAPSAAMVKANENPAMQIVSIDLDSGALQAFNLGQHRDWPVDERKEAKP